MNSKPRLFIFLPLFLTSGIMQAHILNLVTKNTWFPFTLQFQKISDYGKHFVNDFRSHYCK